MSAAPLRLIRDRTAPARPRLELITSDPRSSQRALILLIIAAIGVFGVVGVGAMTADAAVQARGLEGDVEVLKERYELLTAEVAELESPERIHSVAVRDLGMVEADDPEFIVIDGDGRFALHDPVINGRVDHGFTDEVKQVLATQP